MYRNRPTKWRRYFKAVRKAGGLPHSKTYRQLASLDFARSVLECASPLALSVHQRSSRSYVNVRFRHIYQAVVPLYVKLAGSISIVSLTSSAIETFSDTVASWALTLVIARVRTISW